MYTHPHRKIYSTLCILCALFFFSATLVSFSVSNYGETFVWLPCSIWGICHYKNFALSVYFHESQEFGGIDDVGVGVLHCNFSLDELVAPINGCHALWHCAEGHNENCCVCICMITRLCSLLAGFVLTP